MTTREKTLLKPIRFHGYMRMTSRAQHEKRNGGREGCGKDAPWKSPKADFPTELGNPAKNAGFPLFTQPRLLLGSLSLWTHWLRPKPTKMAPFLTGVDTHDPLLSAARVDVGVLPTNAPGISPQTDLQLRYRGRSPTDTRRRDATSNSRRTRPGMS